MTRRATTLANPWHLTERQMDVMAALIDTGCDKLAARVLGLAPKTVSNYMEDACQRIGAENRIRALIEFDRKRRAG